MGLTSVWKTGCWSSAALTVRAGAWADPQGLAGAMGMTAGMLTEGTKTRGAQEIASQTEALGAVLSSGGGQESSAVTLNVMPEKLPAAMAIMADVARNPAFGQGVGGFGRFQIAEVGVGRKLQIGV